jgi:hypothetical protein
MASIVLIILIVGWRRVGILNTRRSKNGAHNLSKLEIKRFKSLGSRR